MLLPLLESDLYALMRRAAAHALDGPLDVRFAPRGAAATVVVAADGYPGAYAKVRERSLSPRNVPSLTATRARTRRATRSPRPRSPRPRRAARA